MTHDSPTTASPPGRPAARVSLHDRPWLVAGLVFAVAFLARLVVVGVYPDPWQFDAYQRWAARDHLWVQVWLPATQVVVWGVAQLGGGLLALRVVMSAIAAATVAMGALLARRLGGERSAWLYLPMALFGPYLMWSVVPYQESTLLLSLFGGLLLTRRWPWAGALVIGALAFCRYEGWPILLVYIAVERRWSSLLCLWGVLAYFGIDALELNAPYAASPDSFQDWEGLENKLTWRNARRLFVGLWYEGANAGLQWIVVGALFTLRRFPWERETTVLVFAFLGQMAATVGWMFSLGIVFSRMAVLPGMVIAVVAAAEVGRRWDGFSPRARQVVVAFTAGLTIWSVANTAPDVDRMFHIMRYDVGLVRVIEQCPSDVWSVVPRRHPGPRRRHDGCEVIQGLTDLRAGSEFTCKSWGWETDAEITMTAQWSRLDAAYRFERVGGVADPTCPY